MSISSNAAPPFPGRNMLALDDFGSFANCGVHGASRPLGKAFGPDALLHDSLVLTNLAFVDRGQSKPNVDQ